MRLLSGLLLIINYLSLSTSYSSSASFVLPLGIHPLDEKYYASKVIRCKDGSNSFTRDQLNDDFCDCADGTDEPGTSACPNGKFYCKNAGHKPQYLFSSRINDHICDCCDGSDEHDGSIFCPNTCVMGGNAEYKTTNTHSIIRRFEDFDAKRSKSGNGGDSKLKGLKLAIILQSLLIVMVVVLLLCRRRLKHTRRNSLNYGGYVKAAH